MNTEKRFDCPELGFYNMTDAEMIASLQEDAAKGDNYAAACLRARGIKPEGRASEGPRAKPDEPGHEVARPETGSGVEVPPPLPEPAYPAGTKGMLGENCFDADQMRERDAMWMARLAATTPAAAQPAQESGGKTGWPAGMLQDDSRELSRALASKPDARLQAREAAAAVSQPAQQGVDK